VATTATIYCANHPNTETLLHCYRCGKPICVKCATRTPVGLICKECLNNQQAGFYTVTSVDYVIAAIAGGVVSIAGGAIAVLIGFFLFEIFYAPFAGGIIAEVIRYAIHRHRGRYIWLIGCAMVIVGGMIGAGLFPLLGLVGRGGLLFALFALPTLAFRAMFNIGFLIYIVLAVGTVYARLRYG
jgi:hypothetical protein